MSEQNPPAPPSQPPGEPPASPQAEPRPIRKCRCGHDRSHPLVHPEPKYSAMGWFLLLLGATPTPKHAVYVCSRCQQTLGITRDPRVLREFS